MDLGEYGALVRDEIDDAVRGHVELLSRLARGTAETCYESWRQSSFAFAVLLAGTAGSVGTDGSSHTPG